MPNESKSLIPTNYFLEQGYIFVSTRPAVISAVLGSCVAVALYDRKRMVGGMNHFQLPCAQEKQQATARYGDAATLALIRIMISNGSKTKHLEAQIFGGAYDRGVCPRNIGRENAMIARKILRKHRIRITSEDVGGEMGRKVVFQTDSNKTAVLKVDKLRKSDWYPYEDDR